MKLKSLEISGFKSFADKTNIDFQNGMTGIVGPNGSGKSNIIEAIRWVMGEQSAKGLRGDKMIDVIFGGSAKRQPLSRAEVSVVFDNSDKYLASEFNEIQISRKLYRDGTSKYSINGVDARLKDVTNLFTDTGIGRESFSIISQGRVEEIFNSKPEERRAIIEEVAGIFKYKKLKEKAEGELALTNENLDRVEDIISEIQGRVEPLEAQAKIANEFLSYKQEYDLLDRSNSVKQIIQSDQQLIELNQQLTSSKNKQSEIIDQIKNISLQSNEAKEKIAQATTDRDILQDKLLSLTQQKERLTGQQNLDLERSTNRQTQIDQVTQKLEQLDVELAQLQTSLKQNKELLQQHQDSLNDSDNENSLDKIPEIRNLISQLRSDSNGQLEEISRAKNLQSNFENSRQENTSKKENLSQKINLLETKLNNQLVDEGLKSNQELTNQIEHDQKLLTDKQTESSQLITQLEIDRNDWIDKINEQSKKSARLQSLQTDDGLSSYANGVKNTLAAKSSFNGIVGPLAELIKVDSKYILAIETLLGNALQNIVVDQENTAVQIVKHLRDNKLGRATFLPIDTIKSRSLDANLTNSAKQADGFIDIASNLVSFDQTIQKIVENLLGSAIVADDIDAATKIAKSISYRARVVTIDGQIINAGGSLTGGAAFAKNGLLSQQKEIKELETEVEQSKTAISKLETQINQSENSVNDLNQAIDQLKNVIAENQQQIKINQAQIDLINQNQEQDQRELQSLKTEFETINSELDNFDEKNQQLLSDVDQQQEKLNQLTQQIEQNEELLNNLSDENLSSAEQKSNIRELIASIKTKIDSDAERITQTEQQINEYKQQNQNLNSYQLEIEVDDVEKTLANLEEQLADIQNKVDANSNQLEIDSAELANFEMQLNHYQEENTKLLSAESSLSSDIAKFETRKENAINHLNAEYQMTFDQAKVDVSELPLEEIQEQLKPIKEKINSLGNVNLGSIEEYENVSKRYNFLIAQSDDLHQAKDKLLATMSEMDDVVIVKFKETFDEIAEQFAIIFEKMFGGGKAQLTLTDPDNLLTSGIDIMAQPPGKKFQSMTLMSGGEKALTAITLLFSILEVRPVPFAILDETEAALDESNVDRFANYLHNFAGETQFIVITHRKGTMTNADVLYGVTMQESGVSKMVSVELDEFRKAS